MVLFFFNLFFYDDDDDLCFGFWLLGLGFFFWEKMGLLFCFSFCFWCCVCVCVCVVVLKDRRLVGWAEEDKTKVVSFSFLNSSIQKIEKRKKKNNSTIQYTTRFWLPYSGGRNVDIETIAFSIITKMTTPFLRY